MKDPRDEKLERLLRSRRIDPASPDLAQRIIFKARQLPQKRTVTLWQGLRQLCAEFHLPKPAYVLASALIVGMVIGFSTPSANSHADDTTVSVQSVFSTDEALL